MGKRSAFKRHPRDLYQTPPEGMDPILPFISGSFCDPCAGDGRIARYLKNHGMTCKFQCDIFPLAPEVEQFNSLDLAGIWGADQIITNPPWQRKILHRMIPKFSAIAPTWLLFDAAWAHTGQAAPFLKRCAKIVAVGRLKWFPGSKSVGKEDVSWYHFVDHPVETIFVGKTDKKCDKTKELF